MMTLFNGYESGFRGWFGERASGRSAESHGCERKLTVSSLHGWSQSPPGGNEWPLALAGRWMRAGRISISTRSLMQSYRRSSCITMHRTICAGRFGCYGDGEPVSGCAGGGDRSQSGFCDSGGLQPGRHGRWRSWFHAPESGMQMNGAVMLTNSVLSVSGTPPLKIANAEVRFSAVRLRCSRRRGDRQ